MGQKQLGIVSGIFGFTLATVEHSQYYVVPRIFDGTWNLFSESAPPITSLYTFNYLSFSASFLIGFVGVFLLGYRAGRQFNISQNYRSFVTVISGSATLGYLFQIILLVLLTEDVFTGSTKTLDLIYSFIKLLTVPVQFGIAGFAGAAYAHFNVESTNR